jgi:hypothetical protein
MRRRCRDIRRTGAVPAFYSARLTPPEKKHNQSLGLIVHGFGEATKPRARACQYQRKRPTVNRTPPTSLRSNCRIGRAGSVPGEVTGTLSNLRQAWFHHVHREASVGRYLGHMRRRLETVANRESGSIHRIARA